jgi:hypothetical protein
MMTQARLDQLAEMTALTVPCAKCLGRGYIEQYEVERDPKCNLCIKGQVAKHPEILELVTEVMRLRYLLKHKIES